MDKVYNLEAPCVYCHYASDQYLVHYGTTFTLPSSQISICPKSPLFVHLQMLAMDPKSRSTTRLKKLIPDFQLGEQYSLSSAQFLKSLLSVSRKYKITFYIIFPISRYIIYAILGIFEVICWIYARHMNLSFKLKIYRRIRCFKYCHTEGKRK